MSCSSSAELDDELLRYFCYCRRGPFLLEKPRFPPFERHWQFPRITGQFYPSPHMAEYWLPVKYQDSASFAGGRPAANNALSGVSCVPCKQRRTRCIGGDGSRPCEPCRALNQAGTCFYVAAPSSRRHEGGSGGPTRTRSVHSVSTAAAPYQKNAARTSPWIFAGLSEQWNNQLNQPKTQLRSRSNGHESVGVASPSSSSSSSSSGFSAPPFTLLPTSTDETDDDPQLTAQGRSVLLQAFANAIPPDSNAPHHHSTFLFVQQTNPTPEEALRTGNLAARYYRNPVLETTMCWLGCLLILSGMVSGLKPGETTFSSREPRLARLAEILQRRMERLVAEDTERLKHDAARLGVLGRQGGLQTPENLALQVSIGIAASFGYQALGKIETTRAWFQNLFMLWRITRIPGEVFCQQPTDYSTWMLREFWLRAFWGSCNTETTIAAGSRTSPNVFPARDFPTAPFPVADTIFTSLPVWSPNLENPPDFKHLMTLAPKLTADEFLTWLDFKEGPSVDPATRHKVLKIALTDLAQTRAMLVMPLMATVFVRLEENRKWFRDVAGLRKLDVILADLILSAPEGPDAYAASLNVPLGYLVKLFGHAFLDEALKRRRFLRDAFEALEVHLPPAMLVAMYEENFEALLDSLPDDFEALHRLKLVSSLAFFQLGQMLIRSPEPFADLLPDQSQLTRTGSFDSGAAQTAAESIASLSNEFSDDDLLGVWLSSPLFVDANHHAILISRMMEEIQGRLTTHQLQRQVMISLTCYSAIYAAWLQLLTLRRTLPAGEASEEIMDLRSEIIGNIKHCLGLLDKSGRPQAQQAGAVIRKIMESEKEAALDKEQLELVMMAKQLSFSDKDKDKEAE